MGSSRWTSERSCGDLVPSAKTPFIPDEKESTVFVWEAAVADFAVDSLSKERTSPDSAPVDSPRCCLPRCNPTMHIGHCDRFTHITKRQICLRLLLLLSLLAESGLLSVMLKLVFIKRCCCCQLVRVARGGGNHQIHYLLTIDSFLFITAMQSFSINCAPIHNEISLMKVW
jgi:hypothetical protein